MENAVKRVVYLFGAGATHAELIELDPDLESKGGGLLTSQLSKRVMWRASRDAKYTTGVEAVTGTEGSLNIELLISLIENSKVHDWTYKTARLRSLVERDISSTLSKFGNRRPFLHKGLLELHSHRRMKAKELVLGLISLNYDDVLDYAYREIFGGKVNYCFPMSLAPDNRQRIPLLKLHGSFNWKNVVVCQMRRTIEIIPLGTNKSYIHPPFGFIWNRALDILTQCDALRVIGCSLSPNDVHLIDLLFKAQLERPAPFDIEIVDLDKAGEAIKSQYGFFKGVRTLSELGVPQASAVGPLNPFKTWLHYTAERIVGGRELKATRYLRRVAT